ncbi:MAG TPA: hypothetical protein PKV75_07695 [Desulfobacterales bacterium]|nr:hypothetical protein [Desulfobacterales bacterium]
MKEIEEIINKIQVLADQKTHPDRVVCLNNVLEEITEAVNSLIHDLQVEKRCELDHRLSFS